jgi:DNA-binding NtrC family response regulator
MNVLLVDDQRSARRVLGDLIALAEGAQVTEASSLDEARRAIEQASFDLAFVDLRLADDARNRDGIQLLKELRERPAIRVVVVSALGEMAEIRAAMRAGAWDYVLKDDLCEEIVLPIVDEARTRNRLERELLQLRVRATGASQLDDLVGVSPPMERLRAAIGRVALSDRPVLVIGPSGSGKELVVRAIHALGPHPSAPLLDLNCGAMPEALIEAQLFGHERGAFTGADRRGVGFFAATQSGTLFLDEIAELPVGLQSKLLRVLETRRFRPVGSVSDVAFDGRVVAATHADLGERVREGRFREDLFHRLDVLRLRVPALDERREDIPALVAHFAARQSRALHFDASAFELFGSVPWPGNVRQLRNLIDRLAVFSETDTISAATIRGLDDRALSSSPASLREAARVVLRSPVPDKLTSMETALIEEAMSLSGGNKTAAARLLGVHRKVIERRTKDDDVSD